MKHPLSGTGGKGSAPRDIDKKLYDEGWNRIFGHKKQYERNKDKNEDNKSHYKKRREKQ